jgi:hypothetical protein
MTGIAAKGHLNAPRNVKCVAVAVPPAIISMLLKREPCIYAGVHYELPKDSETDGS